MGAQAIALSQHDADNDGCLSTEELEAWVGEQVTGGRIQALAHIDKYFVTQYKRICAHKFVFYHSKRGKVCPGGLPADAVCLLPPMKQQGLSFRCGCARQMRIRDLLTSPVMKEWQDMAQPKSTRGPPASNWFTLQVTSSSSPCYPPQPA